MSCQHRSKRLFAAKATLAAGLIALPLVVVSAAYPRQTTNAPESEKRSAGALTAVLKGRVTDDKGVPLADARVRVISIFTIEQRLVRKIPYREQPEARTDDKGDYRLELPFVTKREKVLINVCKRGYRGISEKPMRGLIEVEPGGEANVSGQLSPGISFVGKVVDQHGSPIAGVKINAKATVSGAERERHIEETESDLDGGFEILEYPFPPLRGGRAITKGTIYFSHPDYIDGGLENVYAVPEKERETLRIVLEPGHKIGGTVLDLNGKPVPKASVTLIRKDGTHRRATLTDMDGKFTLRGVSEGLTMLTARALDIRQQKDLPMAVKSDKADLELRLKPIDWRPDLKRYDVAGMVLADVTPELRTTYDLGYTDGAVVLDPGKDPDRTRNGQLTEGCSIWMVGIARVGSVRELVRQIPAQASVGRPGEYSLVVFYTFGTRERNGSDAALLILTEDDIMQLRDLAGRLSPEAP